MKQTKVSMAACDSVPCGWKDAFLFVCGLTPSSLNRHSVFFCWKKWKHVCFALPEKVETKDYNWESTVTSVTQKS